jgi:hypothetical protein
MPIIGVAGKAGSGKDTVGQIIRETSDPEWQIKKFADGVKEVASILTGIPREEFEKEDVKQSDLGKEWSKYNFISEPHEQSMTIRELLQKIGTDAIRNYVHHNAWVNCLMSKYNYEDLWVITDVRFPNEAEAIRNAGGVLIRIERDSPMKSNHISETALDSFNDWDYIINNKGTLDELRDEVHYILMDIQSQD